MNDKTKIDFYLIADSAKQARLCFACRLIEKAYKQKHRIYIHTMDQPEANELDELLWTYRDDSFLPHNLYGEGPHTAPPIQIGYEIIPENHHDILINLNRNIPTFYQRFSRIIECVSTDPIIQSFSRDHYRFYREQGFNITTHKPQTNEQ